MSSTSLVRKEANESIDKLELAMLQRFQSKECPLNHSFFDGIYVRECVLFAGMLVTSKIHVKKHPYVVLKGKAEVFIDGKGWELIEAPYFGTTEAGTRRVLRIIETCHWITFHSNPDDGQDLEAIEDRIIEKHENELLTCKTEEICHGLASELLGLV